MLLYICSGVVGDWKRHFTVTENEKFDALLNKNMNGAETIESAFLNKNAK